MKTKQPVNSRDNRLYLKVVAQNVVNAEANRLAPLLRSALEPFVGKKAVTQSGGLAHKVKQAVDAVLPEWKQDGYQTPSVWIDTTSPYSIRANLKVCRSNADGCAYAEQTVYLGKLSGDILEALETEWKPARTDYSVEELREKRRVAEELHDKARAAESALYPFGKFDQ